MKKQTLLYLEWPDWEHIFSKKQKQKKNNYNIVQPIPLTEKNQKMG